MDVNIMCFRRLLIVLIVTLESMCKSEDCYCLKKLVGDINSPVFVEQDSVNGNFYVAQQTGVVHIYSKDWKRESKPLVNLTNDVHISNSIWDERGLLSIALHPQFHSNKQIFTYSIRLINGKEYAVVSKLEIRPDLLMEDIILAIEQTNQKLNGGQALFGNDGLLYVSIGDGGSLDNNNISFAQSSSSLLGKILRINVDETEVVDDHLLFYSIPNDNPFVGNASWRSEIFALGARNMWRCSVDKGTGYLFCGDVGDTDSEEINLIKSGKNYGWNIFEGSIEKINRTKNETIEEGVSVHQVLPGIAKTKIYRHMPFQQNGFVAMSFGPITWFLMKTADDGAQTVLYATLSELAGKTTGFLYKECAITEYDDKVKNEDLQKKLWSEALKMTSIKEFGVIE